MKTLLITITLTAAWTLLSCKDDEKMEDLKSQAKQDSINKKVVQTIYDEEIEFYYSDFNDLKHNKSYDRFFAGQLDLPTGQTVCTDPIYRELAYPQSWSIPKGRYPVYLYIGLENDFAGRVAYAELVIKDEIPAFWEMSLIPEKLLDTFERKMNGLYPVENGLSCFADLETFKIYEQEIKDFYKQNKDGNYYNDILDKHFKENKYIPKSSRGEDWINYRPAKATGNIIMFGSGNGDGLYPKYVGFDKNRNVIKFVTDFIKLDSSAAD